jgi:hypothetical protein
MDEVRDREYPLIFRKNCVTIHRNKEMAKYDLTSILGCMIYIC